MRCQNVTVRCDVHSDAIMISVVIPFTLQMPLYHRQLSSSTNDKLHRVSAPRTVRLQSKLAVATLAGRGDADAMWRDDGWTHHCEQPSVAECESAPRHATERASVCVSER